ncbi:MAG: DUF6152 family protein [Pseudomonadota bacterium]
MSERRPGTLNLALTAMLCTIFGVTFWSVPVQGHHSRAAFDLATRIAVEGTVTEVSWTNPHYYFTLQGAQLEHLDVAGEHQSTAEPENLLWTFEGHSVPGLVRNGWSRRTLTIGTRVRVVANPNKQDDVPFALLDHVTRADGKTYYAFRQPPAEGDDSVQLPLTASADFTGTWRLIRTLRNNLVGVFEPPRDWPLTPLGQQELAQYDSNDDPSLRCEPRGLPRMLTWPYAQQWQQDAQGYVIRIEHSDEHRRIYAQPGQIKQPDDSGYSWGGVQADRVMQITSDQFPSKHWGNARGISSSAQKTLSERYELLDDGYRMRLTYTLTDPQYLLEPVSMTAEYAKIRDFEFAAEPPCDTATATRHLQFE